MRPRPRFLMPVAIVALLASACSSGNVAATVSGVEITDDEVLALSIRDESATSVQAANPCQGLQAASPGQVCVGFRDDLTVVVFLEAMTIAAADDFGITDIGSDAARDAFFASASPEAEQVLRTLLDLPGRSTQAFADLILDQLDVRTKVQAALIHDERNLIDLWEQRPAPEIDYCVRHILVSTEEEAFDVSARIEAGENFSAVASEVSLDASSAGGALLCPFDLAASVPPFADAVAQMEIGDISDPVQTEFGWHIIAVGARMPTSYEELASDPERWVPQQAIDFWWSAWLDDAISRADIDVRSQIGTWIPEADGISPPSESP